MIARQFNSFGSLARFTDRLIVRSIVAAPVITGASSRILEKNVRHVYGSPKLTDLAASTQAERVDLGFTPNEPLVRSGGLRDSMERESTPSYAAVGSPDPVAAYHEFSFINVRTGTAVPERPAYKIGLVESETEVKAVMTAGLEEMLGGTPMQRVKP